MLATAHPAFDYAGFGLRLGLDLFALLVLLPALGPMTKTREVTLDRVYDADAAVRADVEHRLGLRVIDFTIIEVDFVREVTRLSIRYVEDRRPAAVPVAT